MTPTPHSPSSIIEAGRAVSFQYTEASSLARSGTATVDIVIPVYNEERALPGCLRTLHTRLREGFPFPWRITVADNASTDATLAVARDLAEELPGVTVVHLDRKGRGLALRTVWGESDADIVTYMDVDLSTGLDGLLPLVAPLASGHSGIAIGSRLAPGARTVRGARREIVSRCYNGIIRLTHGVRFTDAQCGFKAARTEVLKPLLRVTRDDAWFFDTELLLLAEHNGLRVHEVPVDWVEDVDTRVDVISTATDDLKGLWRMARLKASGAGRVPLPHRPAPRAEHPDAVLAPSTKRSVLSWELGCFVAIGVASTAGQALLYWLLRDWWSPVVANLVSLVVPTLLNTEANRRLTFRYTTASPARAHLGAGVLFVVGYLVTSGAVLWFKSGHPQASSAAETLVLACASVVVTAIRFTVLRTSVFRSRTRSVVRRRLGQRVRGVGHRRNRSRQPFSIEEVLLRVQAILRRTAGAGTPPMTETVLRYADLELDEDAHEVHRAGEYVPLSPTEFKLLSYLMANAGHVVSKAQILDHVWSYDFAGDARIIETYVRYLRKKINRLDPPLIHTVRGIGYCLRLPREQGGEAQKHSR